MGVRVLAAALLVAAACATGTSAGPLRISVPDGWRITRQGDSSIQLADGRAGDPDEPGAATVVFDVYFSTEHTPASYRELLRDEAEAFSERTHTVGGAPLVTYTYRGASFGGRQEAVLVPSHEVLFVYRAARKHGDAAFERGLAAFHVALDSVESVD